MNKYLSLLLCLLCPIMVACPTSSQTTGTNAQSIPPIRENETDSGVEWRDRPQIHDIDFVDEQNIWLVTESTGVVYRTSDGGQNWKNGVQAGIEGVDAIDIHTDGSGWIIDSSGAVWRKGPSDTKWGIRTDLRESRNDEGFISGLQTNFGGRERGWILETFRIFFTNDGGKRWDILTPFENGQPIKVAAFKDRLWVLGNDGDATVKVSRSLAGGKNWTTSILPAKCHPRDIFFLNENIGWVSCSRGNLLTTIDGGETWKTGRTPLEGFEANSIFWLNAKEGWLGGFLCADEGCSAMTGKASALSTKNAGKTWDKVQIDTPDPFFSHVYFLNSRIGWLGARDSLYSTEDGGSTWKRILNLPHN